MVKSPQHVVCGLCSSNRSLELMCLLLSFSTTVSHFYSLNSYSHCEVSANNIACVINIILKSPHVPERKDTVLLSLLPVKTQSPVSLYIICPLTFGPAFVSSRSTIA